MARNRQSSGSSLPVCRRNASCRLALAARLATAGFLGRGWGCRLLGAGCGRGQILVLELARQINEESVLLLATGFQGRHARLEGGDDRSAVAAALTEGGVYTSKVAAAVPVSCASLREVNGYIGTSPGIISTSML